MNLAERLHEEIRSKNKQIIIVGDSMTDVWVHGHLASCQDGCSKFVEKKYHTTPGGAANAERCLTYWTSRCVLYAHHKNFQPTKTRFIDPDGKIVFRYDDETRLLPIVDHDYIRRDALHHIEHDECAGVLLSDYDKRVLTPSFLKEVAATCAARGIPCVVDAKRQPELYKGAIVKANLDWVIKNQGKCSPCVITDGPRKPMVYEGVTTQVTVGDTLPPVRCVNHVGAGDCFAAILTLALAHGLNLIESAAIAYSAGRVYVQHPHNRPPRPEEVIEDMNTASTSTPRSAAPSCTTEPTPV